MTVHVEADGSTKAVSSEKSMHLEVEILRWPLTVLGRSPGKPHDPRRRRSNPRPGSMRSSSGPNLLFQKVFMNQKWTQNGCSTFQRGLMEPGKKITYKIKNYTSGDISISGDHLGRLLQTGQKSFNSTENAKPI